MDRPGATRERFASVRVVVDGRPRVLVEGTRIVLTVVDGPEGTVGVRAGGNFLSVPGGVRDGHLDGQVVTTLMYPGPERNAQDMWLGAFLGSGPRWERDGDELTLSSDDTTIVLRAVPGDD